MRAQTMTHPWPRSVRVALAFAVFVVLVATDVWLLCGAPYLQLAYGPLRPTAALLAGPPEWVAEVAGATTAYVAGRRTRETVAMLVDRAPDRALYTDAELNHLADVRRVITTLFRLGLVAATAIVIALAIDARAGGRRAAAAVARGGQLSVGLTLTVVLLIAVAWNGLFTTFHTLLFPPGTWQFSSDSLLIRLFPEWFWQRAAAALTLLLLVQGVVIGRVARRVALRP